MRRILIFLIVLPGIEIAYSQFPGRDIRFALAYPITTGENFMNSDLLGGKGYKGIIDAGLDYSILKAANTAYGVAFNISILRLKESDLTATAFIPGIFAEHEFNLSKLRIIPRAGFGYSRWRYKGPDLEIEDQYGNIIHIKNKKASNGFNVQGALKLASRSNHSVNWFVQLRYEFTRLEKPSGGELNSSFNRNFSIIYPGAGFEWQF